MKNDKFYNTPWKVQNEIKRWLVYPIARLIFTFNNITWETGWRFHGLPIIQKHRLSTMRFGKNFQLRSAVCSNPLGPNHPVILCTWKADSVLEIGDNFGMTGGSIVVADMITIGDRVIVGANTSIIDTDFHPLALVLRQKDTSAGKFAPIVIEDDVFIGMNSLILKGVRIGRGAVVGAGSVVASDVLPGVIVAGNPARIVKKIK